MRFFTWGPATDDMRLQPLLGSAQMHGIHVCVIPCKSLLDKLVSLRRSLDAVPRSELVLCSDGYDCLYLQPAARIESVIKTFSAPIIFSAQAEADHHLSVSVDAAKSVSDAGPYPVLNSGIIAGIAGEIHDMLSVICGWNIRAIEEEFRQNPAGLGHFNDQTLCGRYFAMYPEKVAIDSNAALSWTSAYENSFLEQLLCESPFELRNPRTQKIPTIFHLPCTSPGVYLQYLRTSLRMGLLLSPDQVQIVRIEQLLRQGGNVAKEATEVRAAIQSHPSFFQVRRRQYADFYRRRVRILLSRAVRIFIRGGTGVMTSTESN